MSKESCEVTSFGKGFCSKLGECFLMSQIRNQLPYSNEYNQENIPDDMASKQLFSDQYQWLESLFVKSYILGRDQGCDSLDALVELASEYDIQVLRLVDEYKD